MQYELYSKDEQNNFYYHMTANDIKTVLFFILKNDDEREFIIIDNYDIQPINYRLLGFKQEPTGVEHKTLIYECKLLKYIDCYVEQGIDKDKVYDLSVKSAKKETAFYFMKINEFPNTDY